MIRRLSPIFGLVVCVALATATEKGLSQPVKSNNPPVTIPAYWAKAIRVAEAREERFLTSCDGSLGTYTVRVWADTKYYYVRFDGLPGTNKPYHPSFQEDVISQSTFAIVRRDGGDEPYE